MHVDPHAQAKHRHAIRRARKLQDKNRFISRRKTRRAAPRG